MENMNGCVRIKRDLHRENHDFFFTNVDTPNDSLESEPRIGTVDPHVGK